MRPRCAARALVVGAAVMAVALSACGAGAARPSTPVGSTAAESSAADGATRSAGCKVAPAVEPGVSDRTLTSGGVERRYLLDVPEAYDGTTPLPVVLGLHSLTVDYHVVPAVSGFEEMSARYDFIGVFPSGRLDDGVPYWLAAPTAGNHDVRFISDLLDVLEAELCVDPSRVYSTGISNGAQMSSLLACELSSRVTAVAPVAGVEFSDECDGRPVAVVAFHGTADPIVTYDGGGLNARAIADLHFWKGQVPADVPEHHGVDAAMRAFAAHNGCAPRPVERRVSPEVRKRTWRGCDATTELYVVDGGGHTLPGHPVLGFGEAFGATTLDIDATALMFDLFSDDARTPRHASDGLRIEGAPSPGTRREWPMYGHDLSNTRLNPNEKAITRAAVPRLSEVWSIDGLVGVTGTPAVVGDTAYFGDWTGTVRAVRTANGHELWSTAVAGGSIVGAPAIDGEAVYVGNGRTLYRLDRATGAIEWEAITDDHPNAQINASPVVVDGIVLQGTASFENVINKDTYTFRGSIGGYDADTGEALWKFFTTPNDTTSGAGVGIWSTPAVDVERGLLYVGTGQNLSEPTGRLADSLIALDYRTGALAWSRQFTYPDVFSNGFPTGKDADVGASPTLWTSDGRDIVGAGDKGGTFHALDRDTGKIVWERQLTPGSFFGGQIGSSALVDGTLIASSNVGNPDTNAPTDVTRIFGLDPASGGIRWRTKLPGKVFAPVSAVPGVAFIGTDRGTMAALDTDSGEKLWSFTAPAPTACGPSIVAGRVLWGYGFTLFDGPGDGGLISFALPS